MPRYQPKRMSVEGAKVTKPLGVEGILAAVLPPPMSTDAQPAPGNNQVLARLVVACHVMTQTSCFAGSGTRGGRR